MSNITHEITSEVWDSLPPAAQKALFFALQATVFRLEAQVGELQAEVAELKARLNQNSTNSHKPPSTDFKKHAKKESTGKPRGGRPGHDAHFRALVPEEELDSLVVLHPERCDGCGELLRDGRRTVGKPVRHQVTELPVVKTLVTEYRLFRRRCGCCGTVTRAQLPDGVPTGMFGPRFTAFVALLAGRFRLSKRETAQLVGSLTDTTISPSCVVKLCCRASEALAEPYEAIAAEVRRSPVAYVDETTNRRAGKRTWLWVAVAHTATLFRLADTRSRKERKALLGENFNGIVVSDRFGVYDDLPAYERAVCHAHLKRDLAALVERGGRIGRLASLVRGEQQRMFKLYHAREAGDIDHEAVQRKLRPLKARLTKLVREGKSGRHRRGRALFEHLWKLWPALFTFLEVSGVEGTNSNAERALRPAVIWRKTCFGTASDAGDRFVERMLSVAATCLQRGTNLFQFLCYAVDSHFKGLPATSVYATP